MLIIKLDAIPSTNSYLRMLSSEKRLKDYTVVQTTNQTEGRGQRGTSWYSEPGKNLALSVFKDVSGISLKQSFLISIVTSLAVLRCLKTFGIPKLKIKWPNDILAENKKICGILIENVIQQHQYKGSIIGIGLNVNQITFNNLPQASSLKSITGRNFNFDELTNGILKELKKGFKNLEKGKIDDLKLDYEEHLFRINKPSTFKDAEGNMFSGYIKNVSDSGALQVLLEDGIVRAFDLKALTLMY
ncbi:biotin--[acetyl-CoA-carboxylase] ligase [Gaetbulibacter aestuarii]|uniref:Biotin--[acetyl-CoA-carboxylase] ligase n=1 Tax=Gaetbulibacter aestuarii TaxID=1502358 RepID=A0ABW7MY98_9FLAO